MNKAELILHQDGTLTYRGSRSTVAGMAKGAFAALSQSDRIRIAKWVLRFDQVSADKEAGRMRHAPEAT